MKQVRQLTPLFTPEHYDLALYLQKRFDRTFSGTMTLKGDLPAEASEIILQSKDLAISTATIDGKKAEWKAGVDDELALSTGSKLAKGPHTIQMTWEGKITDPMHGIYPCYFKHDGKDKELLMTQFENTSAREAFPCIDEPAAKATLSLTLVTEPGIVTLSNTPVKSTKEEDGNVVTTFEDTPRMSTYLLAFVIGELGYKEVVSQHGVHVRVYATPDNVKHTAFAVDMAAKLLDFYDDYFDLPYPLPKADLVACPDFAAGAMENWGLTTYRENALLYDEKNSDATVKEWVAAVISHELSHQWFGDLVTMKWWDDLWLNESFARWAEHYAVDKLVPEWKVWEQFGSLEQPSATSRDSLAGVQAVREKVLHPDQLDGLFDPAIVYTKGACLVRMLQGYVGEATFRDALRLYMQRHKYSNADADDLWDALDTVSGRDVSSFMKAWVQQPGHPVVSVDAKEGKAVLTQRRFFANPKQPKDEKTVWPLPLLSNYITDDLFDKLQAEYPIKGKSARINNGYVGFYHVKYDDASMAGIIDEVKAGTLPVTDRQGLLLDAVSLARAGEQSTADAMKLLAAYSNESSFPVWQAMSGVIGAARTIINDDPTIKPALQKYVAELAQAEYKRLGWEHKPKEAYFDELLRPLVIGLMAYAEVPEVVDKLLAMFDAAQKPEDVPVPEFRSTVFVVAVRERGRPAYDKLLEWYKAGPSAEERVNIILGITSMRDEELAADMTKLFTNTKLIKLQDFIYWFIYGIRNRYARQAVWQWMQKNWGFIEENFGKGHDFTDFPKYSATAMVTREEWEMYKAFFEPMLNNESIAMVIRQGVEEIETRVLWRERDLDPVSKLLRSR